VISTTTSISTPAASVSEAPSVREHREELVASAATRIARLDDLDAQKEHAAHFADFVLRRLGLAPNDLPKRGGGAGATIEVSSIELLG
jgi:hypothetical protein